MRRVLPVLAATLVVAVATAGDGRRVAAAQISPGDWTGFGRTADQNRHSPLAQITPANVGDLGRVFKVDFRQIDPTILRGQQSYPLAIGGRLFVTTNDNNVFALDATDGRVIWRYTPPNRAVFANFGIRANRGVAACDGKLFLLTLDMHIVSLDQRTGRLIQRIPIAGAVPGAGINYGYSETSAPMCANGRLVLGAAGSEYGVRGFVMAYTYGLKPAWANPFWTIPPDLHGWRRPSRLVGGGVVWTPTTIDASTNTLYFGTGSATPLYWP
jgi:alcohol dehydrogenase (cytochrome c)